ncbi:hypothetical protein EDD85DRAFT_789688 [Armillaria nabsnona]|nr:hypothetical protein EDD85DRAFT_789688 [Armillaria nabsnona]
MFGRMRDLFLRCVPDSLKIENSITFPDHSTSLLSHNKSWRYLQEIRTRHKRTQVELTQTQTNAVERTHAGVERRILLAPMTLMVLAAVVLGNDAARPGDDDYTEDKRWR